MTPYLYFAVGQNSVVSLVTHYRMDSPGIKAGGDTIFCTHPDWRWGLPSLLYSGYQVFTGGKQPVRGIDH
jgi:hypothetical protein